jgi:2-phospho-L-lactate guanylyltransferase
VTAAWALVPVKTLAGAKSRLAPALTAAERGEFATCMARDVLRALRGCPAIAGIALLARTGEAVELAREFDCRILTDDPQRDLAANLQEAAAMLAREGVGTVLILPTDLPTLMPADVDDLLAAHSGGVTVVPAARDGGTNALVMTPPDAAPCLFGLDSAHRHLDAARRLGLTARRLELPAFARDIDTVDDVLWLRSQADGSVAKNYLAAK